MIFSNVASKKRSWVAHDRDLPLCFTGLTCFIFCKPTGDLNLFANSQGSIVGPNCAS